MTHAPRSHGRRPGPWPMSLLCAALLCLPAWSHAAPQPSTEPALRPAGSTLRLDAQPPAVPVSTQAPGVVTPAPGSVPASPATPSATPSTPLSAPTTPVGPATQSLPSLAPAAAPEVQPAPASVIGTDTGEANTGSTGPRIVRLPPAEPQPVQELPATETMDTRAIDPLNPERNYTDTDGAAETDLWARVRRGFAMPDLQGDLVRGREQYYADRPDYVRRMTERGGRYLFHVVEELEKRNMPMELALLPFIESAFNPQAMSTAKASGMWQFIPSTGKDFSLKQNIFRDDRRDVLASTRAALDYLSRLHRMFGDWHLALAAYNWGEGSVQRAINRNLKAGLPTDYASLNMPDETRLYVPKLQAVKNIVQNPENFGLSLPTLNNHPYFLSVPIERDIDVDLAARLAGVSMEEFKQLNPQMNKPVILAAGTEQVLLPYDNANRFVDNLRSHQGQLASWTAWVAPRTLRSADAARQVGMSESELRQVNRIPPKMLVKAGSTLLVPRSAARNTDVSEHLADNAALSLAPDVPPLRRVSLRAGKRGETVAAVARRYKTSAAQVAQWNKTSASARFKPGSTIVVWVPQTATRVAAAPRGKRAAAPAAKGRPATVRVAARQPASKATAKPASRSAAKPVRVATAGGNKARSNVRMAQR